jgi:hypothetical protein
VPCRRGHQYHVWRRTLAVEGNTAMEHDDKVKLHRADPGRKRMIWLDVSDPDGAYDALMTLVHESASRGEHEHVGTVHRDESES